MAFYPGPGIGGHCIPLDPHYLSWKARQHGFDSRFISLAEEVNSRMPEHVVQLVADGLNDDRKAMKGSNVLLLGVAYKKDINDVRESPALSIIFSRAEVVLFLVDRGLKNHGDFCAPLHFFKDQRERTMRILRMKIKRVIAAILRIDEYPCLKVLGRLSHLRLDLVEHIQVTLYML
jgi:UDP-N-acetyl-D-mannosaminuronate dehydrogenase